MSGYLTLRASPAGEVAAVVGPRLLAGIVAGPGLYEHRSVWPAPRTFDAAQLLAVLDAVPLHGRGGAGFPFARKLRTAVSSGKRRSVVVNAGEGEPASAKDSVLLVAAPHLVLDGAEAVARALGVASRWTAVEAALDDVSLPDAVRVIEDYRPLDVQCAAAMLAFARNLRRAEPGLVHLFDGDGGDENWKSYPLEDSEITIRSVVNNPLLYHEGWGVDSIKHSLTYSGGFSRGVVRGYAPARAFGFIPVSPLAMRGAIGAALSAPLSELVGEDVDRLLALKGSVVRSGLRGRGADLPIAEKRRFQHGAIGDPGSRLRASRAELRAIHERRFAALEADDPDFPRGEPSRDALSA